MAFSGIARFPPEYAGGRGFPAGALLFPKGILIRRPNGSDGAVY